jgi:hypothetical protein
MRELWPLSVPPQRSGGAGVRSGLWANPRRGNISTADGWQAPPWSDDWGVYSTAPAVSAAFTLLGALGSPVREPPPAVSIAFGAAATAVAAAASAAATAATAAVAAPSLPHGDIILFLLCLFINSLVRAGDGDA